MIDPRTPDGLRAAMKALGLRQRGLAEALEMGKNGDRTIRNWLDKGEIPGPAAVAVRLMLEHSWRPAKALELFAGDEIEVFAKDRSRVMISGEICDLHSWAYRKNGAWAFEAAPVEPATTAELIKVKAVWRPVVPPNGAGERR